ncbi:MAG: hypothetical protein JSV49_02645 [Thermoplasmata archaeon]|nr:MAG: hypothetical protein JSV49_02645 [Thermoplasmata archaeon]
MSDRHVYGGVFHPMFEYVRERHGVEGVDKLFRKAMERGYTSPIQQKEYKIGKKYPFDDHLIFLKSYIELYGEADFDRMTRATANKKGIVGFFIKWKGTPELLIKKAGEYWPNFHDFGKLEGIIENDNTGYVRGYDISLDPIFCRSLTQYFTGIMENLKLEEFMITKTKCVHKGDNNCEWEIHWKW